MENIFFNTGEEEIDFFSYLKKNGKLKTPKIEKSQRNGDVPAELKNIDKLKGIDALKLLASYMEDCHGKGILHVQMSSYGGLINAEILDDLLIPDNSVHTVTKKGMVFDLNHKAVFAYVSENGQVWECQAEMNFVNGIESSYERTDGFGGYKIIYKTSRIKEITVGKWRKSKLAGYKNILNPSRADEIVEENKYLKEFRDKYGLSSTVLLIAPQIEQLVKAGFKFAVGFISTAQQIDYVNERHLSIADGEAEEFNRLTQPGKNLKEIFKTGKPVYQTLKDEEKLSTWDTFRKMYKQGKISKDIIQQVYDAGYDEGMLSSMANILGKTHNGKPVFTWQSLQTYLGRIDMYEAIDVKEGVQILMDYLSMCQQLNIAPRIDGDSLKREHDVVARIIREKRDELMAKKMKNVGEKHRAYRYDEHVFFGRFIEDYDDLIDEAKQQHNCVASYAKRIADGKSFVCVVREKARPEKSLATIELALDCTGIRQKFLAYNQPIRNKALTEFIDRYQKHCREVYLSEKKLKKTA